MPPIETAGDYSTAVPANPPGEDGLGLAAKIEGLLFTSAGAVGIEQLCAALQLTVDQIEEGLKELAEDLVSRGVRLQRYNSQVQLTTAPELAAEVERLLGLEATTNLTHAALEVLAIVAYQQPATRPQIDSIRGVNSESALHTLVHHGLVEEAGRSEGPGRPILYVTTPDFLQRFGLSSVAELPPVSIPDLQGVPPEGEASVTPESDGEAG